MYIAVFKRLLDIIWATIALIILFPLLLGLVVAIKIDSRGPVFFVQKRVTKDKEHFSIYKFRTMQINTPSDTPTHLLDNPDQWITQVGKFMRRASLDELPQLINIIRGDMSIVGPRPALWNQFDLLEERDKCCANDVMPGLTGWAQVNGRDTVSIEDKARYDGYYVEHASFLFDMRCFILTIVTVLKRDGVQEGGRRPVDDVSEQRKRLGGEARTDNR